MTSKKNEEPIWVNKRAIAAVHDRQLAEHGGGAGVRDEGLFESALARPLNAYGYGQSDLCELAALYAAGIVRNHPFVDGNKRTGFMTAYIFLARNGLRLVATEEEAVKHVVALAAEEIDEEAFAAWLRSAVEEK